MLVVVGLNRRSASLEDRQLLALPASEVEAALEGFLDLGGIDEVAVVSTRYRVEVYAKTSCPAAALLALRQALTARAGRDLPLVELQGEEAFRHLVRVASSLESPLLGEPQILGQVKDAFARAVEAGAAGGGLTAFLDRALRIARRVRAETAIGRSRVTWGDAAEALAEKVLGPLAGLRVAAVGTGDMARFCAEHLRERGASLVVLDAADSNAESLAADIGAEWRPLAALEDEMLRADVVVSAIPFAADVFRPEAMTRISRARRRALVIVDLSEPRAIPPESGLVRDIYLCDVEDLDRMMSAATGERAGAVRHAERVIEQEIARWAGGLAQGASRGSPTPAPGEVKLEQR